MIYKGKVGRFPVDCQEERRGMEKRRDFVRSRVAIGDLPERFD